MSKPVSDSNYSKSTQNSSKRARRSQSTDQPTAVLTMQDRLIAWPQQVTEKHWRLAASTLLTTIVAGAVGLNLGIVNLWERQVQSLFFELRGPVEAPEDIVILAIDQESLSQGQHYRDDPERYEELRLIEAWPWRREAYAKAISRLMEAGALSVSLDVLFTTSSTYGLADDAAFAEVLERYSDRLVLAANYDNTYLNQGTIYSAALPLQQFQETGVYLGSINFLKEPNDKIHQLGQAFLAAQAQEENAFAEVSAATFDDFSEPQPLSFAQATLAAAKRPYVRAQVSYPGSQIESQLEGQPETKKQQENIFFYGPGGTFEQIPFWYVLDSDLWRSYLGSGNYFQDKMVIIGTTAPERRDFHQAPFAGGLLYPNEMAGVEVLANTVATLDQTISPTQLVKYPTVNALAVFSLGLGIAALFYQTRRHSQRALVTIGGIALWGGISYVAFTGAQVILMTGTPMVAIASMGLINFGIGFTGDRFKRKRLRTTLARYATSPLVQEIISEHDDFQDLLADVHADLIGTLLCNRYSISAILGSGGFSETYLAQDTLRPGNPVCVVKQLKIVSDNPKAHQLASRLFAAEASVLERLGKHSQIPRLLAYFEVKQAFYLVQEMIEGTLLRDSLSSRRPFPQKVVVTMLRDLLSVISFVHSQGVIHRDIKPSNIIRRSSDKRYVLIDFGAVKTISNKVASERTRVTSTVGIGTQGYMPSEQSAGMPTVRSDLYALGITAIEALTGRPPHVLRRSEDGEIIWSHTIAVISPELRRIINRMVRYDFNKRYESSEQCLADLNQLDTAQLIDASVEHVSNSGDSQLAIEDTVNQGTRPGVILTNLDLDETKILPKDWLNDAETKPEDTDLKDLG
ncbi:serine/threonine-protein kinase [cf. Phormidesmis sp. LEGE 11477]|uniref:serine/threonine-protein kinase n=1 Tax=cf. Phormidesmis sp. LEGE 11477 TaxID=1828680 RepID=UPI00187FAB5E|nr:serine/threonine-protein kinase [cf. Phormidesmis sp. LEGE 11477]MBE9063373.1 CHASE2 domain-containing protein [cf. Phormidesmis sp. LEGE 11477]